MTERLTQAAPLQPGLTILAATAEAPGSWLASARGGGCRVEWVRSSDEALALLRNGSVGRYAFLLVDPTAPNSGALREIRRDFPQLPVLTTLSDNGDPNVLPASQPESSTRAAQPDGGDSDEDTGCYVGCGWSKRIRTLLNQVAAGDAPVLLQGETGSGKEVIARYLHAHSPRAHTPLLKVNCASLPSELVESELFGYERGAFTGAFARKPGKFELANGGTVLLDEIGDMEFGLQAKLLQVLQDHTFDRLGGRDLTRVDVRVMAATHCDLDAAIREGRFRQDLYYRLNVITIRVPPLRERPDEVLPLCEFLLRKRSPPGTPPLYLPESLKQALIAYDWPGNVRELENLVRRLLILRAPDLVERELRLHRIAAQARPVNGTSVAPGAVPTRPHAEVWAVLDQLEEANRRAAADTILAALNAARWNRREAAAILQISYKTLLYRMRKLGIDGRRAGAGLVEVPRADRRPLYPVLGEEAAQAEDGFPRLENLEKRERAAGERRKLPARVAHTELEVVKAAAAGSWPETCTNTCE